MRPVDWKLSLAGLLIGLLVGITGMGGGSLMTPMLVFLFGFKPTVAIGTDILHGAVFKSFGAIRHRQLGTVHARLTGWMLLGSAPCSLIGVGLSVWLKGRYGDGFEDTAGILLGIALIVCGIGFALKTFLTGRAKSDAPFIMSAADRRIALIAGASGGFVVGITSVGSGTFFGLVMLLVFPLTASKVVGTDIFHAAALLWVAGAGHLVAGNVNLHAMGWLLVGSIPGVLLGSNVSVKLPGPGAAARARDDAHAFGDQARGSTRREPCDHRRPLRHRGSAARRGRLEGRRSAAPASPDRARGDASRLARRLLLRCARLRTWYPRCATPAAATSTSRIALPARAPSMSSSCRAPSHIELAWEVPFLRAMYEADRLLCARDPFRQAGTGMSDAVDAGTPRSRSAWTTSAPSWMRSGSRRAAVYGVSEGAPMSILFAAKDPRPVLGTDLAGRLRP